MIKPMLATLVQEPFDREGWIFEIKWDGFRAVAEVNKKQVKLYSRNFLSFNERFEPIVKALQKMNVHATFDGEVVVLDKKGKSHFQLLQNYIDTKEGQLTYYIFDIISYKGKDLRDIPLLERKQLLKRILPNNKFIKYSDHINAKGIAFFKAAQKSGLEGIMAKDGISPYRSGRRNMEWQKIKIHQQQEAVIAGFTEPRGSRKKFGALVLGVYDKGKLIYIGHTGSGFNWKSLNQVYDKLNPLIQKQSPFEIVPKTNAPVTWVKPKLVAEITFAEWTTDGHMRQPIFQGLRVDKKASEVKRELPK